jgi:hypothetical protein
MPPVVHPGRLLKRELAARRLSANRLSLDIGVPSGRTLTAHHEDLDREYALPSQVASATTTFWCDNMKGFL